MNAMNVIMRCFLVNSILLAFGEVVPEPICDIEDALIGNCPGDDLMMPNLVQVTADRRLARKKARITHDKAEAVTRQTVKELPEIQEMLKELLHDTEGGDVPEDPDDKDGDKQVKEQQIKADQHKIEAEVDNARLQAKHHAKKAASGGSIKVTKRAPRTASGGSKDVSLAAAPMKDPQPLTVAEFEALQYRLEGLTDTDKIDDLLDIVGETEAVSTSGETESFPGTGTAEVNLDLQALPAGKQRALFDFMEQAQKEDQAAASAAAADVDFAANDGLRRLAADAAASDAAASDDLPGLTQPTEFDGSDPGAGDWQQQVFTAAVHAAHDVGR